jgi:mono/diheme cytochrome c family protein
MSRVLVTALSGMALAMSLQLAPPSRASAADTAAAIAAGERTYNLNCRGCHAPPFTGFFMLSRRLGAAQADLAERGEVNADYVKFVVRNGLKSMPHIPRGDISNAQLDNIIAYFNRPRAMPATAGPAK